MRGTLTVYRWELRKLVSQRRTYLGLGAAVVAPLVLVIGLALQSGSPNDVPFGRYVRSSGLAIPLVLLAFGSIWLFPLIASLVSGDIVAAEDHNGTLKTILTRSRGRGEIFAGKVLAAISYTVLAVFVLGLVGVVAGVVLSGWHSLHTLSGTEVGATRALALVAASLGFYALPLIAVAMIGILLSTVTRNSAGAVVGTLLIALLMQLLGVLPGLGGLQPYLLTSQFDAWHGLLRTPTDWVPIVHALWICALYAVFPLAVAFAVFERRDVAGG